MLLGFGGESLYVYQNRIRITMVVIVIATIGTKDYLFTVCEFLERITLGSSITWNQTYSCYSIMKHFMASMVYHEPTYRVQGTYLTCQSIPTMGLYFFYRTAARLHLPARSHPLRPDCACVLVSLKSSAI